MIYAACVNAHVLVSPFLTHTFSSSLSILSVCIPCSRSPHANISSFLSSGAPDIKSTIPDVLYKLSERKSWLYDMKMKAKMVFDSLRAVLLK